MWNRQLESQSYRQRRVSLVKEGLSHAQIDSIFEKEEFREIVQESFQTTKEELLQKIDSELDTIREENRIVFEESKELLAKHYRILEATEKSVKEGKEREKKKEEELNRIFKEVHEGMQKWKATLDEENERVNILCSILNREIEKTQKARNQTEETRQFYLREIERANKSRELLDKQTDKLNKKILQYNREIRALRG